MTRQLTQKTLVPLSLAAMIGLGGFYLSDANSTVKVNSARIEKNERSIGSFSQETRKHYIEIIQRLSRIEEAIRK